MEKYGSDGPQMTIWRMRFACSTTKGTDTHSEWVIVIDFPRQQWLRERASVLRYTYIARVVYLKSMYARLQLCLKNTKKCISYKLSIMYG